MDKPVIAGKINQRVIDLTGVTVPADTPIFVGETNIAHMKDEHPEHYALYGDKLGDIISSPDYIAKHPKKDSIEYIKVFNDPVTDEHVLVAVRASKSGVYYARSLFVMSEDKKRKYRQKGAFKNY